MTSKPLSLRGDVLPRAELLGQTAADVIDSFASPLVVCGGCGEAWGRRYIQRNRTLFDLDALERDVRECPGCPDREE